MNFTNDLDKDIIVHRMGLYSVKRYSYTKFNYIDAEGKPVKERIFSFILMRGQKWFNETSRNFAESELNTVIETYENILVKMKTERKVELTMEREVRKTFPRKHEFVFNNVTIVAIELPCYYSEGRPYTHGNYFEPTEKMVEFYANGLPYRKKIHAGIDAIIDLEFILENTIKNDLQKNYDKNEFKDTYAAQTTTKLNFNYIPIIYILGYVYELDGKQIEFHDYSWNRFKTTPEVEFSLSKIMSEGKLIGELQGMKAWSALLNKTKFV